MTPFCGSAAVASQSAALPQWGHKLRLCRRAITGCGFAAAPSPFCGSATHVSDLTLSSSFFRFSSSCFMLVSLPLNSWNRRSFRVMSFCALRSRSPSWSASRSEQATTGCIYGCHSASPPRLSLSVFESIHSTLRTESRREQTLRLCRRTNSDCDYSTAALPQLVVVLRQSRREEAKTAALPQNKLTC